MPTPEVGAVLERARIRISAHGWRQGAAEPGERRLDTGFTGYCLEDAVRGKGKRQVDDSAQVYGPGEKKALELLADAIALRHPEEYQVLEVQRPLSLVVAWNDARGRTNEDVVDVLKEAEGKMPPFPLPMRTRQDQHDESQQGDDEMTAPAVNRMTNVVDKISGLSDKLDRVTSALDTEVARTEHNADMVGTFTEGMRSANDALEKKFTVLGNVGPTTAEDSNTA